MNLQEIQFRLNQAKLNLPKPVTPSDKVDKPAYYTHPISTSVSLSDLLPPKIVGQKMFSSVPLIVPRSVPETVINGGITRDDSINTPTGQWLNPIMTQALARQANKEQQLKSLIKSLFLLILSYLLKSIIKRLTLIFTTLNIMNFDLSYINIFLTTIKVTLLTITLIFLYTFLKPQDQCLDLPLNNQQRELIGLKPVESNLNDLTSLTDTNTHSTSSVPKYNKFNDYLYTNLENLSNKKIQRLNSLLDLTYTKFDPNNTLKSLIPHTADNDYDLDVEKDKFNKGFDLKFN